MVKTAEDTARDELEVAQDAADLVTANAADISAAAGSQHDDAVVTATMSAAGYTVLDASSLALAASGAEGYVIMTERQRRALEPRILVSYNGQTGVLQVPKSRLQNPIS